MIGSSIRVHVAGGVAAGVVVSSISAGSSIPHGDDVLCF